MMSQKGASTHTDRDSNGHPQFQAQHISDQGSVQLHRWCKPVPYAYPCLVDAYLYLHHRSSDSSCLRVSQLLGFYFPLPRCTHVLPCLRDRSLVVLNRFVAVHHSMVAWAWSKSPTPVNCYNLPTSKTGGMHSHVWWLDEAFLLSGA